METHFADQVKELYKQAKRIIYTKINIPADFEEEFARLVDKVNLGLMADKDNFYGYFLLHMSREISFAISSPTAVNFKGAKYVIYFNPLLFLNLTLQQMESTIKHEILHILSLHLLRAKEFKAGYSQLAVNMAMDIVVNTYLDDLPPYATTLEWVNLHYSLKLLPFEPFEYYAEKLQPAIDLLEADKDGAEIDSGVEEKIAAEYDPEKTHDLWEATSDIDEQTLREFTAKFADDACKGGIPNYAAGLLAALKTGGGELPWNLYLKRLMGAVESDKKKTVTRRSRRQPARLDIRGELRSHKAKIAVALDISGSINDEEFQQAVAEVLAIVKNYHHEITIIECDNEIRRAYKVKAAKDIKDRSNVRGGTRFSPVFEYANRNNVDLLIYFTDGKGEDRLLTTPRGYKTLWVISGRGDKLSLQEAYGAVKKLKNIAIKEDTLRIVDVRKDGYSMNDQERMHI